MYERKDESFCSPNTFGALNLLDAKQKCGENSSCIGFYDKFGRGNTFYLCSDGADIKPSSGGSVMYIKATEGKSVQYWEF